MRQILLSLLGILIIVGAVFLARNIMAPGEEENRVFQPKVTKVFTRSVENGDVTVEVEVHGRLEAVNKVGIFAEVQGIFFSSKAFRPGTYYKKGELLISVDNAPELAALKAQRATLLNQIVQLLPDIKFDYPEEYDKWSSYVSDFDVDRKTRALPETNSDREKFFIASKNLSTTYYNIKNLEARLDKYRIYAPFSGILTEALVTPGALIRPGQQLGTLMGQDVFELALPIREEYSDMISVGASLDVLADESGRNLTGRIVRINPEVDPGSQSITAYVQLQGEELKEGMFFHAELPLTPIPGAMEIDRKLLVKNQFIFGVEDSSLVRYDVIPRHYNRETVVVTGLEDGRQILERMIPSAREGMKVEVVTE